MVEDFNKHNHLSPIQFGFRAKFSATDDLLYVTENIRSDINNNKMIAAAFRDLSKAFESISHQILSKKLEGYHFDSTAIVLIKSYLTNRTKKSFFKIRHQIGLAHIKVFHWVLFLDLYYSTSTLTVC